MNERRGHWYLLTGAVIGAVLGLLIAWVVFPVPYVAASPASLRADFKDEYRYMIAASYAASGNLGRARARLVLLEDKDSVKALGDQYQRMTANNTAPDVLRSVADLSQAIQADTAPQATAFPQATATALPPLPSPTLADEATSPEVSTPATATLQVDTETPAPGLTSTLQVTSTLLPTFAFTLAPRPTHTSTFTPGPPFTLVQSTKICEPGQPGLLQITLVDSNGQPVAGVELVITWAGGEEHFFTGLKPELGNGYADFVMSPNVEYALSLSNGSTRVTGLSAPASCAAADKGSYNGIHLEFKQP
ncbi:MAG: hypothetical protein WA821_07135 [Anaerolineales bacterium]